MANEVLSQDEVMRLLSMLSGTADVPRSEKPVITNAEEDKAHTMTNRVGKDRLKKLQCMHEQFARLISAKITNSILSCIDIRLACVDEFQYSEFIFGLNNPSCFNLLRVKTPQGDGDVFFDLDSSAANALLERLLGGGREPQLYTRRPMTRIETRLIRFILEKILEELTTIWRKTAELTFEVIQTESNPQLIQVVEPNEEVVVICFDINLVDIRSSMSLCIPVKILDKMLPEADQPNE